MSHRPTTRTKAARLMALMKQIDNEVQSLNDQRRFVAQLRREALKLIRSTK